jgi:hypothetical protein
MATFPQPFKEAIIKSQMSHAQIASLLNLKKRRWQSIFYGKAKMDSKEFKDIKTIVEKIQRTV